MDKSFNLKVQTDEASLSKTNGQFTIEPLSRVYGITLGNAMRRVLLTSIPGAAITHLNIEGVEHEFSSIKGVTIATKPDDGSSLTVAFNGQNYLLTILEEQY